MFLNYFNMIILKLNLKNKKITQLLKFQNMFHKLMFMVLKTTRINKNKIIIIILYYTNK